MLEPVCCKKRQKSPNQETGLGNRGTLEALIDTKLILNEHEWLFNHTGSTWYQPEPLEVPYCPNQFLGLNFFAVSYSKPALAIYSYQECFKNSAGIMTEKSSIPSVENQMT